LNLIVTATCKFDGNQREQLDNAKQHLKDPTALGGSHISIKVNRHSTGSASTVKDTHRERCEESSG